MACVWKSPKSPYWQAQFTGADGRRINRSTKQKDRKKAQGVADKWESASYKARAHELTQEASVKILGELMELTLGERLNVSSIHEFFHAYVASRKAIGRAEATTDRYDGIVDSFLTHLGEIRAKASLNSLTAGEIEAWRDAELLTGKGGTTVDFGVKVLRAILNAARRKSVITTNPAEAVELIGDGAETRDPFPPHELQSLLDHATTDWKGAILSGLRCGPRLADTANLTRENIDLEEEVMKLDVSKTKRKSTKQLVIAMHPELVEHFRSLPAAI